MSDIFLHVSIAKRRIFRPSKAWLQVFNRAHSCLRNIWYAVFRPGGEPQRFFISLTFEGDYLVTSQPETDNSLFNKATVGLALKMTEKAPTDPSYLMDWNAFLFTGFSQLGNPSNSTSLVIGKLFFAQRPWLCIHKFSPFSNSVQAAMYICIYVYMVLKQLKRAWNSWIIASSLDIRKVCTYMLQRLVW